MSDLRYFLDALYTQFHQPKYLTSDPLEFPRRYSDPWDQEAIALVSALLAYGNVKQIRKSVESVISRINKISPSPKEFVLSLHSKRFRIKAERVFVDFVHRFNKGSDLVSLFDLLRQSWEEWGSLGGHFLSHHDSCSLNIEKALSGLINDWRTNSANKNPIGEHSRLNYLLTSPLQGSCCKRWCMFLRWMGRRDALDLGLWTIDSPLLPTFKREKLELLSSHQLIMPLDTHTGRICRYLGLTLRNSSDWKTALEVTAALKKLDPVDPTRYDFAISRLGILDLCQREYRREICQKCQLVTVCQFAQKS